MLQVWITPHAVDRASQRLLETWLQECPERSPGLMTWLEHRTGEAMKSSILGQSGHVHMHQRGISFECQIRDGRIFVKTVGPGTDLSRPKRAAAKEPRLCATCREPAGECGCP